MLVFKKGTQVSVDVSLDNRKKIIMNGTIELVSKKYVVVSNDLTNLNYSIKDFRRISKSEQEKSNDLKNIYLRSTTVAYE